METDRKPPRKEPNENPKPSFNAFARYSGMAFQIAGAVILGGFAGYGLDKLFGITSHIFITIFLLLGVFFGLYSVFKDLLKK